MHNIYLMGVLVSESAVTGPWGVVSSSPFHAAWRDALVENPCSILVSASLFFVSSCATGSPGCSRQGEEGFVTNAALVVESLLKVIKITYFLSYEYHISNRYSYMILFHYQ